MSEATRYGLFAVDLDTGRHRLIDDASTSAEAVALMRGCFWGRYSELKGSKALNIRPLHDVRGDDDETTD